MNYIIPDADAPKLNAALQVAAGISSLAHQVGDNWVYYPQHLANTKIGGVPLDLDSVVVAADVGAATLAGYVAGLTIAESQAAAFANKADAVKAAAAGAGGVNGLADQVVALTDLVAELAQEVNNLRGLA